MTQEMHLADLLTFTRDGEWGKGEPTEGYSPSMVVRGTDFERVRAGNLDTLPVRYIRTDILARKAITAGDTLIETAGGTKDQPTGRSVFIPASVVAAAQLPLVCASFARFLRPDPKRVDPQFLFWKLQDEYHSRRMMPYHVQHTGVARFQYTQFAENYPFSMPSLREQRIIAATLGALDDKIELNRKMNATLEAMARALFRDWFVDFGPTRAKMEARAPFLSPDLWSLFPDRLDEEGKPEGWEMRTLESLFDVTIGRTPPRKESEHFLPADVGVPWLSIKSMGEVQSFVFDTDETLAPSSVKKFKVKVVPAGTVLVSFKLTVGRVAIAGQDMATNEAIAHLVRHPQTPVSDVFAYCAMKEFDYATLGSTSSIATAVNSASIKSIALLVPSPQVQEAFTATAQVLLDRIRTNVLESRTLAQTRDLLLPRLMSGELRVADLDPAEREAAE